MNLTAAEKLPNQVSETVSQSKPENTASAEAKSRIDEEVLNDDEWKDF